ncbi:MAG: cytochrome-c peroxidase [Roseobacter sp.]
MRYLLIIVLFCCAALPVGAGSLPDPVTDDAYAPVDLEEAKLGQLLFYDPILSGNKTVACATCHHPKFGTADGVSLSFGDGGIGLGPHRRYDPNNIPEKRIPRNAPALFNLGAKEFNVMFHDGRLEADPSHVSGLRTPMDDDMLAGFASILSAQTMFPVLSRDEMAGSYDENDVARAVRQGRITGEGGAWDMLAKRVASLPEYNQRFKAVYPHIAEGADIDFTDISNAIAAFMAFEWRSDTSVFDAVLRGQTQLQEPAATGMTLFYGDAACADCHAGPFLTDHGFHAMGTPQIGPGKAATFETHNRDDGRFRVTGQATDQFAFRTPSLRNVALTAPYGHAGSHRSLSQFIEHHADPVRGLQTYAITQAILPKFPGSDTAVMSDPAQVSAIAAAVDRPPLKLEPQDIAALVAFLETLTDPAAIEGRLGIPQSLPSGLPLP